MKKHLLLLLIISIFHINGTIGQSSWTKISDPGKNLNIVTKTTGFTYFNEPLGSHGNKYTLQKSTDGNRTFNTIKSKSGDMGCYSITAMHFTDSINGFFAENCQGLNSIYKTDDGGQTWLYDGNGGHGVNSMCYLNDSSKYLTFFADDSKTSFFLKNYTIVYTSKKYFFDNSNYQNHLTKIKFINDSTGFIICADTLNNAVILKTTNHGYDWSEKKVINNIIFNDISFVSDSIGFVVGSAGNILKSIDCGENWQIISSNTTHNLYSIDFFNDSEGYVVGQTGKILKTQNQGKSWNSLSFINSNDLIYVRAFKDKSVYVNDIKGSLYFTDEDINTKINENIKIHAQPNPANDFVTFLIPETFKNYQISLYNLYGNKILTTNKNILNVVNLVPGIYIATITTEKFTYSLKIVKK